MFHSEQMGPSAKGLALVYFGCGYSPCASLPQRPLSHSNHPSPQSAASHDSHFSPLTRFHHLLPPLLPLDLSLSQRPPSPSLTLPQPHLHARIHADEHAYTQPRWGSPFTLHHSSRMSKNILASVGCSGDDTRVSCVRCSRFSYSVSNKLLILANTEPSLGHSWHCGKGCEYPGKLLRHPGPLRMVH